MNIELDDTISMVYLWARTERSLLRYMRYKHYPIRKEGSKMTSMTFWTQKCWNQVNRTNGRKVINDTSFFCSVMPAGAAVNTWEE